MNTAGLVFFLTIAVLMIAAGAHYEVKSREPKVKIVNRNLDESL